MSGSAPGEPGLPPNGLESETSGRWLVSTESGALYLVDLDAMTLRRTGGLGALRRDDEDIVLRSVIGCRVGAPAYWGLAIYPDVVTVRETTGWC